MTLRIAIVGPGRVGQAFARAFVARGAQVLGFVGRDRGRTGVAVRALGHGAVLSWSDLARAHVVVFAVGDAELAAAIGAAAVGGGRRCSLWLHTSGRHGLDVFAVARPLGVRIGSLHPVAPFPDALTDLGALRGAPAVLAGPPPSLRLLRRLAALLGLEPIECGDQDRVVYHAACALMANGLTALFGLAADAFAAAGGLAASDGTRLCAALGRAALAACAERGAGAALSGPVRRGDAETVALHLDGLAARAPGALATYRALMRAALELARGAGLDPASAARVAAALADVPQAGG